MTTLSTGPDTTDLDRRGTDSRIFTSTELLQIVPISYRQLDHWCRRGYLPGHGGPQGPGNKRQFTVDTLLLVACLAGATRCGLALTKGLADKFAKANLYKPQSFSASDDVTCQVTLLWSPTPILDIIQQP